LKYLDRENARRREIVEMYDNAFKNNPKIKVICAPHHEECSYHIYEIVVPDREALLGKLAENEIYGGVHYRDNIEYSMYRYAEGTCPKARELSEHIITLPMHMWLTDGDVTNIANIVNDFVK
jgi:dTDP-4-amino-4,6-dideoxygalactose transaminase